MKHWADKYLKLTSKMDCSELVEYVLRDHFNVNYAFPKGTGSVGSRSKLIRDTMPLYTKKTDTPKEGDLVLMNGNRLLCHVGMLIKVNNQDYVLHTDARMKTVAVHKIKELASIGYTLGGFYEWLR